MAAAPAYFGGTTKTSRTKPACSCVVPAHGEPRPHWQNIGGAHHRDNLRRVWIFAAVFLSAHRSADCARREKAHRAGAAARWTSCVGRCSSATQCGSGFSSTSRVARRASAAAGFATAAAAAPWGASAAASRSTACRSGSRSCAVGSRAAARGGRAAAAPGRYASRCGCNSAATPTGIASRGVAAEPSSNASQFSVSSRQRTVESGGRAGSAACRCDSVKVSLRHEQRGHRRATCLILILTRVHSICTQYTLHHCWLHNIP